ncbi:MAG: hypothetical protein O3A00_06330 [Planctomycetota bacterium]|nr:hypothetical protein [Planctomycetota bacterium]
MDHNTRLAAGSIISPQNVKIRAFAASRHRRSPFMSSPGIRQLRNYAGLIVVAVVIVIANGVLAATLLHGAFFSGWMLALLVVALLSLNARKKLPFLPLGPMSTWLRLHIRWGLLSGLVFGLHVGIGLPNGTFDGILFGLFVMVFLSGLAGWMLTRAIPRRLTARGEEVIFERIPIFLHRIRGEVEQLVSQAATASETSALPDFYRSRLQPFFQQPRHMLRHLLHSQQPRQSLLLEIKNQRRFLDAHERDVADVIADRVRIKDDLDYHFALQLTLKLWLFIHIPLSYSLLVFGVFHVLVVYAFLG